ncbi:ABC transporter substrate-binding protein [Nocardioides sp. W7]|uniref:ABC transporter substrate-binding protein n=1 Tax=Nocardioides sp. W7 TaxID=2931390 RepID=UPI001FD44E9F|nr:ABC transporter substrate-binding protein [Nocardioides sp. W7]
MTNDHTFAKAVAAGISTIALVALSACGGSDGGDGEFDGTVMIGTFPSLNSLSLYTDAAKEAFEKEGLQVEFKTVATPAEAAPQLIGGQLQFSIMDMTTPITAASQGTDFAMVAPSNYGTPLFDDGWGTGNLWVAPGSDITSVEDIPGHKFGVPAMNSQIWLDIRTAVDEAGGDSSKIEWIETGATGITNLKSGQVDVTTTSEPSGTALAGDKEVKHLAGFVSAGGDLAFEFVSTQDFANTNPELVEKFERAVLAGNKAFNAMSTEEKAALAQTILPEASPELLRAVRFPTFLEEEIGEDSVKAAIDRMEKYGLFEDADVPAPEDLLPKD